MPLARTDFANVDDIAWANRQPIENDAFPCVRKLARNMNVNFSDTKLFTFGHVVDQIEFAGILEREARFRLDVRKDVTLSAVHISQRVHIAIHLALIEVFARVKIQ